MAYGAPGSLGGIFRRGAGGDDGRCSIARLAGAEAPAAHTQSGKTLLAHLAACRVARVGIDRADNCGASGGRAPSGSGRFSGGARDSCPISRGTSLVRFTGSSHTLRSSLEWLGRMNFPTGISKNSNFCREAALRPSGRLGSVRRITLDMHHFGLTSPTHPGRANFSLLPRKPIFRSAPAVK